MSVFQDLFELSGSTQLDHVLGDSAIRTSPDGTETTVTIRWSPGEVVPGYFPDGKQVKEVGVARISPANLATWSTSDTWRIRGQTWAVASVGAIEPVLELQLERRTEIRTGGDEHFAKRS